jgi:hypothetical protein
MDNAADNTFLKIRGWSANLAADAKPTSNQRLAFSGVIEKFMVSAEKRGWDVGHPLSLRLSMK